MEAGEIPKLRIRSKARGLRAVRGLAQGYAEGTRKTVEVLEKGLIGRGKQDLTEKIRNRKVDPK